MNGPPRFSRASVLLLLLLSPRGTCSPPRRGERGIVLSGRALPILRKGGGMEARVRSFRIGKDRGDSPGERKILLLEGPAPPAWAEFALPRVPESGLYLVRLSMALLPRGGKTRWSLEGRPLGPEFDGRAASPKKGVFQGGPVRLEKGGHPPLKMVFSGGPGGAGGIRAGLIQVRLIPLTGNPPKETRTFADLPDPKVFSHLVRKILSGYPADGTHSYWWPRGEAVKGWAGNTRDLRYQGRLFSPGDPKGRCYCCGLTFEVFFRAWRAWCRKRKRPFRVDRLDFQGLKAFRAHWFGSNGDLECVGGAIPAWGLGFSVPPLEARPGDFVQFWRIPRKGRRASGHSVIFLAWIRDGKNRPRALRYWSTQGATRGIGFRQEPVGVPGGVDLSRVYAARVGRPPPP